MFNYDEAEVHAIAVFSSYEDDVKQFGAEVAYDNFIDAFVESMKESHDEGAYTGRRLARLRKD